MTDSGSRRPSLTEMVSNAIGGKKPTTNFKINTSDYLGMNHEAYKTRLFQLALTQPDDYFKLRELVLERVKTDAVSNQYDVFYNLLSEGTSSENAPIVPEFAGLFKPSVPLQETNQFALKASKTIDAICEEAVEMLIPMDYKEIAEKRLKKRTEGNLGF